MRQDFKDTIERTLKTKITHIAPLSVGFGLTGFRISCANTLKLAIKASEKGTSNLLLEGSMLRTLQDSSNLPIPTVHLSTKHLLVMDWIEGHDSLTPIAQQHAAELLAQLHNQRQDFFGYNNSTVIGPLKQPNAPNKNWLTFFKEQRLLYMAQSAFDEAQISHKLFSRLEKFCDKLDNLLPEPNHPSLLHGDLWTGNILVHNNRIAGLIDPAIYYGHPEIELAFTTLFGTFGTAFFDAYENLAPLEPGFHKERLNIYNLYPLLVHVRLFGSSYIPQINTILQRHGV